MLYGPTLVESFEPWYSSLELAYLPILAACFVIGWLGGTKHSLMHGVLMSMLTVGGYALLDTWEQPWTYVDPVTWETALDYFGFGLFINTPSLLFGSACKAVWKRLTGRGRKVSH